MNQYIINIKSNGISDQAELYRNGDLLLFKYKKMRIKVIDTFPFRGLRRIREELETKNIYLLLNGSRRDVNASGITMYSEFAYEHQLGKLIDESKMVNIFENTKYSELIGTVKEQSEFVQKWINSIKDA